MKKHLDRGLHRCGSGCTASSRHLKYKKGLSTKFIDGLKVTVCIFISELAIFWKNNRLNDGRLATIYSEEERTEKLLESLQVDDRIILGKTVGFWTHKKPPLLQMRRLLS